MCEIIWMKFESALLLKRQFYTFSITDLKNFYSTVLLLRLIQTHFHSLEKLQTNCEINPFLNKKLKTVFFSEYKKSIRSLIGLANLPQMKYTKSYWNSTHNLMRNLNRTPKPFTRRENRNNFSTLIKHFTTN